MSADDLRQLGQHRQRERGGFAGAGLRYADQVMASDNGRYGGSLNWGRLGVTGFLNRFENIGIKAKRTK
jgi:hypothetical protein